MEILESGVRVCVDVFGKNLDSAAIKMFSRLIYVRNSIRSAKIMVQ